MRRFEQTFYYLRKKNLLNLYAGGIFGRLERVWRSIMYGISFSETSLSGVKAHREPCKVYWIVVPFLQRPQIKETQFYAEPVRQVVNLCQASDRVSSRVI